MGDEKSLQEIHRENATSFANAAKGEYGVDLQCDRVGAEWLDSFIQSRSATLNPSTQSGLIKLLGSFLGECIAHEYGGQWVVDNGCDRVRIGADGLVDPFWMVESSLNYRSTYYVSDLYAATREIARVRSGGLYAARGEVSAFKVYKVLAVDHVAVHLRKYSNRFDAPPSRLDPSSLSLGLDIQSWQDASTPAAELPIGHFPLAHSGFWAMAPALIQVELVAEDELDGYRMWLETNSSAVRDTSPLPAEQATVRKKWWEFWK
jgi:hypothetical protein